MDKVEKTIWAMVVGIALVSTLLSQKATVLILNIVFITLIIVLKILLARLYGGDND